MDRHPNSTQLGTRSCSLPASVARGFDKPKNVVAGLATREQLVPQLKPVEHGLQARVERSPIYPLLPGG